VKPSSAPAVALLLAGTMCLLPFLVPYHQQPVLSFFPEWLAAALGAAAASWATGGNSDDDLLRGARLAAALDMAAGRDDLISEERAFLDASREQADRALHEEQRTSRRLRRILAAAGAALVVAALAAWVEKAARERRIATVACGGGCFLNAILARELRVELAGRRLVMLEAMAVPPNDGGLSLGQAWVALRYAAGS